MAEFADLVATARVLQSQIQDCREQEKQLVKQRDRVVARATAVLPPGVTIKVLAERISEGFPEGSAVSYGTVKSAQRRYGAEAKITEGVT